MWLGMGKLPKIEEFCEWACWYIRDTAPRGWPRNAGEIDAKIAKSQPIGALSFVDGVLTPYIGW